MRPMALKKETNIYMLSVLVCTKNEIHNIEDCIKSIKFADEIVVIDDFSTDGTDKKALELGAKVYSRSLNGDFAAQRNYGISLCGCNWILILDADERVPEKLAEKILTITNSSSSENICYSLQRESHFHHYKATHGVVGRDWVKRLAPKKGMKYVGKVHEHLETPYPEKKLIAPPMWHYTYDNWDAYFKKFDSYTKLMAQQNFEKEKKANFVFDILLRPWFGFFKMYFLKGGILDGKLGFILSVNHFFYVMTKYVRLYYLNRHNGKL